MLMSLMSRPRIRALLVRLLLGALCSFAGSYWLFGDEVFTRFESWWLSASAWAADHAESRRLHARTQDVERMRAVLDEVRQSSDQLDEQCRDLEAARADAEKELQQELRSLQLLLQLLEGKGDSRLSSDAHAEHEQDLATVTQRVQRHRESLAKTDATLAALSGQRHALERRLLNAEESFHHSSHDLQQLRIQRMSRRATDNAQEGMRHLGEIHRLGLQR